MTLETKISTTYRGLFGIHGFARLASGAFLARTGGAMWQMALVLFVLQTYHSPVLTGIAVFWSIAPGLVVSPISGALLDRHGRVRMILLDYAVASLSLGTIALLGWRGMLSFPLLVIIVAFASLTGPLSISGTRSLFPQVVPQSLWDRANAVDSGSMALSAVVGPALAGILVAGLGGYPTFLLTAIFYGLASLLLFNITEPAPVGERASVPLLRSALQGLVFVLRHRTLRGLMYTLWLANSAGGILTIALPVMILQSRHASADAAGELWAVSGFATVIAGLLIGRRNSAGRERRLMALGMGCMALGMAVLTLPLGVPALITGMVLNGIAFGAVDIGLFALRQRRVDTTWFGRAIAVSMSLNFAAMPVGSIVAGPLVAASLPLSLAAGALVALLGVPVVMWGIPRND